MYAGVVIAKFVTSDKLGVDFDQLDRYVKTYGYLAEWTRRWMMKEFEPGTNWVQWTEELRVEIA